MRLTQWIPCWPELQSEHPWREKITGQSRASLVAPPGPAALRLRVQTKVMMSKHAKETGRLRKIVESFPKVTVTVLGDLVADEFIFGEISRVSREAPVLILKHRERTVVPGGGANAIQNLADLGANVLPVGVLGEDEPGRLLLKGFRAKHIPVSVVLKDKSYNTVTKTRILAGMSHTARQQVVRIDREPQAE